MNQYTLPFDLNTPTIIIVACLILILILIWILAKNSTRNERLTYEFITIIAHKFRTPLTKIKWSSDELIKDEIDAYKRQSLEAIQQSNENLIKLTNTLIELTDNADASIATYTRERILLDKIVHDVSANLKDAFHEKNIFFSVQTPSEPIYVKIDKQRIEFVLQTIIENALAYTQPGKNVEVRISANRRHAYVSVADHGIGIDPADMPRVFTKFFRSTEAARMDTEGFGVGLYLARAITERHKGTLSAASDGLGKGSTFTLALRRVS